MQLSWFPRIVMVAAVGSFGLGIGLIAPLARGSSGTQVLQGDADCSGAIAPRDGQAVVNYFLGKAPLSQTEPCPDVGSVVEIGATSTPVPAVGLSRGNPAPAGQPYQVPEGWQLTILGFTANGTQQVLDENQFNDPPDAGNQFSLVHVRVKNVSAGNPGDPDVDFALRMVGSENVGYSQFEQSCGVIPDSFTFQTNDVFEGGSLEGNICFQTKIGESGFAIFTDYFSSNASNSRWLAVQ